MFVTVAKKSEVLSGQGKAINVNGKDIALFNVNGEFFALDNTCLHQGGPLGEGELMDHTVTCPWHGWQYDVSTGKNTVGSAVATFKTKVEAGAVMIEV